MIDNYHQANLFQLGLLYLGNFTIGSPEDKSVGNVLQILAGLGCDDSSESFS